jgi:hypothetical protein
MFPTFIDLAVAMNQLEIEREAAKRERLGEFYNGGSGEGMRNRLGGSIGAIKSIFGQSNKLDPGFEGKSSTQSLA